MKILVVSNNYPSSTAPNAGVFVYNLIQEFVKQGNVVTVISTQKFKLMGEKAVSEGYGEELAKVYRPKSISASAKRIGKFNTYSIGELSQIRAIKKVITDNNIVFDVAYAHFITNGIIAVNALANFNKPIFNAIGESNLDDRKELFQKEYFNDSLGRISGFIAVSSKLEEKLISYGVEKEKVIVRPNAVDLNKFFYQSKKKIREKLGFPLNKRIIVFTGRFIHHKGPLRILQATMGMDVGFIFVGSGKQELIDPRIIFKGKVPSEQVPELLSSADLFVLPTLQEGSCNAIVEAMACGLPIISSDIPEVRDQCTPEFSVLVDPLDCSKIREAIHDVLFNDARRNEMSKNALEYSKNFDIKERAKSILEFIGSAVK